MYPQTELKIFPALSNLEVSHKALVCICLVCVDDKDVKYSANDLIVRCILKSLKVKLAQKERSKFMRRMKQRSSSTQESS